MFLIYTTKNIIKDDMGKVQCANHGKMITIKISINSYDSRQIILYFDGLIKMSRWLFVDPLYYLR